MLDVVFIVNSIGNRVIYLGIIDLDPAHVVAVSFLKILMIEERIRNDG